MGPNANAGKSRTAKIVVTLQMAMCVIVLVAAGLLTRTLRNLENTPLGLRVDGLVVFGVKPDVPSIPAGVAFYQNLMGKLRILPGVDSVSICEERLSSRRYQR